MKTIHGRLPALSRLVLLVLALALLAGACRSSATPAPRITRLEIVKKESPTFEGMSFGDAGQYEKITARVYGEVDPSATQDALITDIDLAPRNANGRVEYSTDVHIIKPIDLSKGNRRIFYDVVNRGNKTHRDFNGVGGNNPTTAADAGSGLLMRRGYTIVFSGWEDEDLVEPGNDRVLARLPTARNGDGSSVVGPTMIEYLFDTDPGDTFELSYPAASLDQSQAKMLVHNHTRFVGGPLVERVVVPASVWSYVSDQKVRINRTDPFLAAYDAGAAFEFVYPAKDPQVLGLGFAAVRDVVSFLRYDTSEQNPLRGGIEYAMAHGRSQSGRFLKGFTYWGFNQDHAARIVFDGILPKLSGAHGIAGNDRFGDTNATGRSYQRHLSAKMEFPFTYAVRPDPKSGLTDGIFARCEMTRTCPKVMHVDTGNEVYLKALALVTTDGLGQDIVLPDNVRVFAVASAMHYVIPKPAVTDTCQQLSNPLDYDPVVRALYVALDDWATKGVPPPQARYAKVSDGTLVPSLPQSSVGFPAIPGVRYTGWFNEVAVQDKSSLPNMEIPGKYYSVLVPKTDADGNEIAGVRLPDVQVPLGTYTGWGLRRAPFAENEDCGLMGQYIPFAATRAERLASGDPRPSLEERYPTQDAYVNAVAKAVDDLVRERLLLAEDGEAFKTRAAETPIRK